MVADGLTKGSADRSALSAVMDGTFLLQHAVHEYQEPASTTTAASSSLLCASSGGGADRTGFTTVKITYPRTGSTLYRNQQFWKQKKKIGNTWYFKMSHCCHTLLLPELTCPPTCISCHLHSQLMWCLLLSDYKHQHRPIRTHTFSLHTVVFVSPWPCGMRLIIFLCDSNNRKIFVPIKFIASDSLLHHVTICVESILVKLGLCYG